MLCISCSQAGWTQGVKAHLQLLIHQSCHVNIHLINGCLLNHSLHPAISNMLSTLIRKSQSIKTGHLQNRWGLVEKCLLATCINLMTAASGSFQSGGPAAAPDDAATPFGQNQEASVKGQHHLGGRSMQQANDLDAGPPVAFQASLLCCLVTICCAKLLAIPI